MRGLGILALGLTIRLAYGLWLGPGILDGDGGSYFMDALRIVAGSPYQPYWPPGMSHLMAGIIWLFGPGWLNQMGLMLTIWLVFTRSFPNAFHGARAQTSTQVQAALLVFAIYPAFIHHSVAPLSQLPVALCLLGIYVGFALPNELPKSLLWGICLGIGALFRPGIAILGAALMIPKRSRWWAVGAGAISLMLVMTWELALYQQHDRWIAVNDANAYNFYLGNNPWTPDYQTWQLGSHDLRSDPAFQAFFAQRDSLRSLSLDEQQHAYRQLAWQEIGQRPGAFLLRTWNRVRVYWSFDSYTAGVLQTKSLPLAILMLLLDASCFFFLLTTAVNALWRPGLAKANASLLALLLLYPIPYYLAFAHPNYHLPLMPLLAIVSVRSGTFHVRSFQENGQMLQGKRRFFWLASLCVCLYIQLEWGWHLLQRIG